MIYLYNNFNTKDKNNMTEQYINRYKNDKLKHIVGRVTEAKKNDKKINEKIIKDHYIFNQQNINIGHYIYKFIHFYAKWRKNKKKILYYSFGEKFKDDFVKSVFTEDYITYQIPNVTYETKECIIIPWEGRDIKGIKDHFIIMTEIRETCFKNLHIITDRKKTLFYDRSDVDRKNILKIDTNFLTQNNIIYINNLITKYTFKETIELLSKTKTLILPVGAGCFNFLFLDKNCSVSELNPHRSNSWGQLFGLSKMVKNHNNYISHSTKRCAKANQINGADDHMFFDEKLKNHIRKFIK